MHDDEFPFFNLVTTKSSGDMKDATSRGGACNFYGIDPDSIVFAEQVHGSRVAVAGKGNEVKFIKGADGLVSSEKGVSMAVFTADCLPVMMGTAGKAAGIVHAGWRGLFKGIIPEAVKLFKDKFGAQPGELSVSIGPHICAGCYSIGEEVRKAFGLSKNVAHFDLALEAESQLKAAGIKFVRVSENCTMHEPGLFFSYRKDKTRARIMSLVKFSDFMK